MKENRIIEKFKELRLKKKTAFMPFVVACDPNFGESLKITKVLSKRSDFLEIGFPYSDPLADGPTIQAADLRALKNGATTDSVFRLIKALRQFTSLPITVLVYANLVLQAGVKRFYKKASESGIDGVLIPDVPVEEVGEFAAAAGENEILQILLVSQTTDNKRLKKILKRAKGFLYLVSVLGVTGARKSFGGETQKFIKRIKSQTNLPLAVGFGISTPTQFKSMAECGADGVIVGSAIVNIVEQNLDNKNLAVKVGKFTSRFKQ